MVSPSRYWNLLESALECFRMQPIAHPGSVTVLETSPFRLRPGRPAAKSRVLFQNQWKSTVVMIPTLLSLLEPEIVVMATQVTTKLVSWKLSVFSDICIYCIPHRDSFPFIFVMGVSTSVRWRLYTETIPVLRHHGDRRCQAMYSHRVD